MQNNTPRAQTGHRERPLQKSMFLPDYHQPQQIIQQKPQPIETQHYHPLKRSSMPVLEGLHQININPSYSNNMSYSQTPHTYTNANISYPLKIQSKQGQHEQLPPNNNISSINSFNSIKPISSLFKSEHTTEKEMKMFNKFEKGQGYQAKTHSQNIISNENVDSQYMINSIMDQLKEKYIPNLIKNLKTEFFSDLLNLKQDFQNLKVQIQAQNDKQEVFNIDMKNQIESIKIKRENTELKQLEKEYYAMERKLGLIQSKLSQNLTNIYNQFEKISQKIDKQSKQKSYKISQVKSILPAIMLQYKESFTIQKSPQIISRPTSEQLIFNSFKYFIDRYGYLLDSQNKYLLDMKGNQIRLDDKHIKLLEQHKILQR